MAKKTLPAAGEEIDSKCLKCKDVTNHTIIAMDEEKIAKVQCNVCEARHIYRPADPVKTKKKTAKKAPAKPKVTLAVKRAGEAFDKLLRGRTEDQAIPYAMTSPFIKDDLVNHPTFGLGVVSEIIPPNKIEMTYVEGTKVLICQEKTIEPKPAANGKGKKKKKQ